MKLNHSQQRAIAHKTGPFLCLAGPGSGKTTVLAKRVVNLIEEYQVSPSSILVVTFTKVAASEMRERFLRFRKETSTQVTFGTFHGVFYGILKNAYKFTAKNIIRQEQQYEFLRAILYQQELEIEDEREFLADILGEISLVKTAGVDLEHYYSSSCAEEVFREMYRAYKKRCQQERLLDFDDMLLYTYDLLSNREDIRMGWQRKFKYILIDEFQDINPLQYEIMKILAVPENNLFIVGDDDQSIYGFRGAKPEIMLRFPKEFKEAGQTTLACNYRSTNAIVSASERLIAHNSQRFTKKLLTENEAGAAIELRSFGNATKENQYLKDSILQYHEEGHPFEEIAVLYRTNIGARFLVELLIEYQIPFTMREHLPNLFQHFIAQNFIAYLHLAMGKGKRRDLLQVMNRPKRYISREALESEDISFEGLRWFYEGKEWMCDRIDQLEEDSKRLKNMTPYGAINYIRHGIGYDQYLEEYAQYRKLKVEPLYEIAQDLQDSAKGYQTFEEWFLHIEEYTKALREQEQMQGKKKEQEGITISTIHSSKGLEYANVYLMDVNEGTMPYHKAVLEEEIEEERRLFYVGITRAKELLHIYWVEERHERKLDVSRFVGELIEEEEKDDGKKKSSYILQQKGRNRKQS